MHGSHLGAWPRCARQAGAQQAQQRHAGCAPADERLWSRNEAQALLWRERGRGPAIGEGGGRRQSGEQVCVCGGGVVCMCVWGWGAWKRSRVSAQKTLLGKVTGQDRHLLAVCAPSCMYDAQDAG